VTGPPEDDVRTARPVVEVGVAVIGSGFAGVAAALGRLVPAARG
jgi:hypothetical protein